MGLFTKDIKNMEDLFTHQLRDIYYAEKQIVKSLPDMIEKATDPQLKQGFQTHLRETKNHVKRLEQVFELTGKRRKASTSRQLTALSRKPKRSPARSTRNRSSMPR